MAVTAVREFKSDNHGRMKMFCRMIIPLFVFCAGFAFAQEAMLSNPDFEQGDKDWRLTPGFNIVKGGGRNATNALYYERKDKKRIFGNRA